jgi:Domain of unknown function (DUF4372)/Transposase DDE domain
MNTGKTIFTQLMEFIPRYEFNKCVKRYKGYYKVHSFTCWEQFLCMSFAQLTYRESLRDIEACLRSTFRKLYHTGIQSKVSKSTLARANENRDWRIYRDLGYSLIQRANQLYSDDAFAVALKNIVYALDSTSIELCVSLFPWAAYSKRQAAVCMHTLLNLRGNIPSVIVITDKSVSELKVLDQLLIEPEAIYVIDRGYIDFARLYRMHQSHAFFVTRARANFSFKRLYSAPVDKTQGILYDQTGVVKGYSSIKHFPDKLRRVKYFDLKTQKQLIFFTNNMTLSAKTISDLYRSRWQIELFFKWIKQHLRIKAFFGRTENAVKTQIWIAVSTYVLVAIVKKELNLNLNLYTILQILSVSLFEKTSIYQVFSDCGEENYRISNQLNLFLDSKTTGQ